MKVLKRGHKASDGYPKKQCCNRCKAELEVEFSDVFAEFCSDCSHKSAGLKLKVVFHEP